MVWGIGKCYKLTEIKMLSFQYSIPVSNLVASAGEVSLVVYCKSPEAYRTCHKPVTDNLV